MTGLLFAGAVLGSYVRGQFTKETVEGLEKRVTGLEHGRVDLIKSYRRYHCQRLDIYLKHIALLGHGTKKWNDLYKKYVFILKSIG